MEAKRAVMLIDEILRENSVESGIFISLLSKNYIKKYNITNESFLGSLKNSLRRIDRKEKNVQNNHKNKV